MARDHARMKVSRWTDDGDWRSLNVAAQHTYDMIVTQPRLSYCGVLDYFPARLAKLTKGNTPTKITTAVRALRKARFIVVDCDTHELLVRSYVRHDGVMQRHNMGKAVARALAHVVSDDLRATVHGELGRLLREEPDLHGWNGFRDETPDAFESVRAIASSMPSAMASGM